MIKSYICRLLSVGLLCAGLTGCSQDSTITDSTPENSEHLASLKVLPSILKIKSNTNKYVITGIGLSGGSSCAIINERIYTKGAEISRGVIVEDIQLTYANIAVNGESHLIRPKSIQQLMDKGML